MKLIIAGSRSITHPNIVDKAIKRLAGSCFIDEIVSGGAKGIDTLGEEYAKLHLIKLTVFPAKWEVKGVLDRSAGHKRNILMGDYADGLLAIWDGVSPGTKHMIDYMRKINKRVWVYQRK